MPVSTLWMLGLYAVLVALAASCAVGQQANLEPGAYRLEIRTEGYNAYAGRITLVKGRTATVDRELEPESPAIEDILMLGKIPRKPTDPAEALRR